MLKESQEKHYAQQHYNQAFRADYTQAKTMRCLQGKESKDRASEKGALDLDVERRGSAGELRRSGRKARCASRDGDGGEARGEGVGSSGRRGGDGRGRTRNQLDRGGRGDARSGRGLGREDDLRDRVRGRAVGDGGARNRGSGRRRGGRRSCRPSRGSRSSRSCGRGRVDGNVGRAVGDDSRVLGDVARADADEVLESLLSLLLAAIGGHAVDYVLGEVNDGAVACRVGVILALRVDLEPAVQALGEDLRRGVATRRNVGRRRGRG